MDLSLCGVLNMSNTVTKEQAVFEGTVQLAYITGQRHQGGDAGQYFTSTELKM